jgi:glutathione S-transferase
VRSLAIQRIVRKHAGLPADPAAIGEAEHALAQAFAVIDRTLAGDRHLAGEAFSLADISLMPYVAALAMLEAAHLIGDLRHLARWWHEVSARDTWRRAIAA